ncbi:hypothetical protein RJT34_31868 [Clitoria ternatea]|uniref:Calmodulin-binding domain-containing protein n=1 Tax=Clitoria ternatea TaxID=43366 RepID=A0AAN9I378_CLITE
MVPSKLGVQADHVQSGKCLTNLKPSSSKNQDGKSRVTEKMKKMKSSRSFQLSDMEPLQSPPSVRRLSQQRKAPPLHVPATTTAAFPQQKKQLVGGSPNYMKPTSSSDAKKELLPINHRNTQQSSSDGKNLPPKCLSNSKASIVSCKESTKTLSRSSSLNSTITLTKTPSFKHCKTCLRKSTSTVLFEDVNAPDTVICTSTSTESDTPDTTTCTSTLEESNAQDTATCSSTLKESKFPEYLILHPGGTESEGASVIKVCPYTYCSLNDHGHASLPSLKSFISARRHLLEAQKNMKLEAVNPHGWKVPSDTKKDSDIEQFVFDGKSTCDEADICNPKITPLGQEIGKDFFIEIYAKEKGADKVGQFNSVKDLGDQEEINFTSEETGIAAEEDGIKQVTACVSHALPKSKINFEEDFKIFIEDDNDTIEADTKGNFQREQDAEDADENHSPGGFHEETCMESYCKEVSYDREHLENIELDESDSQHTDIDWGEEQSCAFNYEEGDSSICSLEETDSRLESLSATLHFMPELWLDDISSSRYAEVLVEETLQEAEEHKSICFEAQPQHINSVPGCTHESVDLETQQTGYSSKGKAYEYDRSPWFEEVFQYLTNEEDNNGENEEPVDYKAGCVLAELEEQMVESSEGHQTSKTFRDDESHEDSKASLGNNDNGISQENQIHLPDVSEESIVIVEEQKLLEENQVKNSKLQRTSSTGSEEQHTGKNWQWATKRKRPVQDNEEMEKSNTQRPNLLPLVPALEAKKADLKHQKIDERKNEDKWQLDEIMMTGISKESHEDSRASLHINDNGISQEKQIHLSGIPGETSIVVQDQKLPEENQVKGSKFQRTSCTGSDEQPTGKNFQWETKCKKPVQDDEKMRKINPRKPNFLPLAPDPQPETADLKHQMMDERKNAEEWMLDFALRQAVTRLAPAGKTKVALLVEAFETVMSIPKCETHSRNDSPFAHARPIQACS